jgi:arsenate reductase (thioredoxin)
LVNQYNVLFVCTGNAARSIMAEAILSHVGKGQFAAYSAGSHPAERVHPETMVQIELAQIGSEAWRTKSWEMFAWPGAPRMDFAITLCEVAARRPLPQLPGNPIWMHWSIPDPEAVPPEDMRREFGSVFGLLDERIRRMVALPGAGHGGEQMRAELERMSESLQRRAGAELMAGEAFPAAAKAALSGEMIPA